MKQDVIITVSGLQNTGDEEDAVEVVTVGSYYFKNQKHYLLYEEVIDGVQQPVTNTVKIQPGQVDVIKNGPTHAHMTFQEHQHSTSFYCTPFGAIELSLNTGEILVEETEDTLHVDIHYAVEMSNQFIGDCSIQIDVAGN